ncbi:ABC transporter membrane spanning protein (dipeptide) [Oscillochloris trichoides DG-6]|uniref:ABC transporter membrane spanning protein (Dipeptide) n=1 Tax=Oscillochloris trichoides DG-6 TaxID=765420 RepID=E1IA54_9CHLR|nr:ABC transporter permease [Oscillochloris trichoides]EFO82056.1 ABC transporter membrane spanning protein (dipeptide) [Oscillochloris trichoides DG-6]
MTTSAPSIPAISKFPEAEGPWRRAWRQFLRQRSAIIGLIMIGFLSLTAIFAPLIAPYDPVGVLLGKEEGIKKRSGPCIHMLGCPTDQPQHLMGVDGNFRDLFSRIIYGARLSLLIGFVTVSISLSIGTLLGALAGFLGGWFDNVVMRILDVVLAFPFLLLAIAIVSVLGPGLMNAMLGIAIVSVPAYARVIRASVLSAREEDYVLAARTIGVAPLKILFGHIMPNAISPLIVQATLGIGTAILEVAALSFMGLGAQPPTPEWGSMLSAERNQVFTAPHLVFFPGLAIMLTVLGFNLIGDGLRDALDPRLKRS